MSQHDALQHDAPQSDTPPQPPPSPWLRIREAAAYANVGTKTIYKEVKAGRLRAARIGSRRDLRLLARWIDEWLMSTTQVREARRVG